MSRTEEFLFGDVEFMNDNEKNNAYLIMDYLPEDTYKVTLINPTNKTLDSFEKVTDSFKIYNSELLNNKLKLLKENAEYLARYKMPFAFSTQLYESKYDHLKARINCPSIWDEATYPFLGHEFHHVLKDRNPEESRLKYRTAEVLPIFYELIMTDKEKIEILKKEILRRRMDLLILDKKGFDETYNKPKSLQYFNSFYYALALYNQYKETPEKVLKGVSEVLNQNMTTEDLLMVLDIYDNGMDSIVKDELADIKTLIKE